MAGHSQFKNIMHKKGKQDAIRSKLFSKLAREITVAAKMGLPDPAMNARLRAAVLAARAENMPKDNIDRAIKKASSVDAENYDEVRYEGYAPGGVAVIIEALTDNRNRTAGEVRSYFTKAGGALAESGAVAFMFDHVGLIEFEAKVATEEQMLEAAIEAGADDVASSEEGHEIVTTMEALRGVAQTLEATFGEPRKSVLGWKPQNTILVDDEAGEKVLKLVGLLEDNDDVQTVYANFEISDALDVQAEDVGVELLAALQEELDERGAGLSTEEPDGLEEAREGEDVDAFVERAGVGDLEDDGPDQAGEGEGFAHGEGELGGDEAGAGPGGGEVGVGDAGDGDERETDGKDEARIKPSEEGDGQNSGEELRDGDP